MIGNPEISIIVPIYNREKYIKRCIDSILAQSFTDFELILVDDGSTDSSGKICDEYAQKDQRVKVVHEQNNGVSAARNSGLRLAKGTYIMFCDSDDWVEKNWCECLYNGIKNTNIKLAMCGYNIYNENCASINQVINYNENEVEVKELVTISFNTALWNKIFIKSKIDEIEIIFPENISLGEDARFIYQYISSFESHDLIFFIDKITYNYQIIEGSLSHKIIDNYWKLEGELLNIQVDVSLQKGADISKYEGIINNKYYGLFIRTIENLFSSDNTNSLYKKYKEFNDIVHSSEFIKTQKSELFKTYPAWYRFLCRHKIVLLLFLYYIIFK